MGALPGWVCMANGSIGCTNNNYASREKCKKCGQPKEVAAMPAIAMPGASFPTYSHYFARPPGGPEQNINIGLVGDGVLQQLLPLGGNPSFGLPFEKPVNQPPLMKGWRNGDWICNCGFHNYSSRVECKQCNAPQLPGSMTLGTKRLASEELVNHWDSKRLNSGHMNGLQKFHPGFEQMTGVYPPYSGVSSAATSSWQAPALFGKGAKQWRNGDWMCTNCDNHNYASRSECNRCKTQRDMVPQPVNAV